MPAPVGLQATRLGGIAVTLRSSSPSRMLLSEENRSPQMPACCWEKGFAMPICSAPAAQGKTQDIIGNEKACSTTPRCPAHLATVLDDTEEEKSGERPRLTTHCQKIPSGPCLTTRRRHSRLSRGAWLLPVVQHPPIPCSTTVCRKSPPSGRLDDTLSESTCGRVCSTTS